MVDIINLILFVIALVLIFRLCSWISKRILLIKKLASLKKECGAIVKFERFPFLPTRCMSEKPDVTVEINDTVYLIKLAHIDQAIITARMMQAIYDSSEQKCEITLDW